MRIGHGYDVHAMELGKDLVLCGVKVKHDYGLKAHSDGDVAIHALCDALLGAAGLGDIGSHFPDTLSVNKNRDSCEFLTLILEMLSIKNYSISNLDITIVAENPKLLNYIDSMRKKLSEVLLLDVDRVNVKATTTEKLGFEGKEEGIAAHAVVLLYENT